VFDAESGLHDNYLRTYDALTGRYLEGDPVGQSTRIGVFSYAESAPTVAVDPLGLDAIFIAFPDYRPEFPKDWIWPLGGCRCFAFGHAGVAVVETDGARKGQARYYEFGRYENPRCKGAQCGLVRHDDYVITIEKTGVPSDAALMRLLREISRKRGRGGATRAAYVRGGSTAAQRAFGDGFDPVKNPYDFTGLNCGTWAWRLIEQGGVSMPPQPVVPSPNALVDALQSAGHRVLKVEAAASTEE